MTKAICERHLRCAVYAVYAVYACAADYMANDTPLALRRLVWLLFDQDQPHISNSLAQQLVLVLLPTSYHHHVTGNSVISQDPMASESRSHTADDSPDGLSTSSRGARKQRMRRKVSRTRTGCMTCKSRRKRCDMTRPCCGDCTRLNLVGVTYHRSSISVNSQLPQECEWPAVKRIAKTADSTALTSSPRVGAVQVPEEQGLSSGETSHLASSAPGPSPDSVSTSTLHPDWSHTRADDTPQDLFGGNLFPPQFNPIDDVGDEVLL